MRTALVSDVHGNAVALEAVLDDLAGRSRRRSSTAGPSSSGPVVLGNADAFLLDAQAGDEPAIRGAAADARLVGRAARAGPAGVAESALASGTPGADAAR